MAPGCDTSCQGERGHVAFAFGHERRENSGSRSSGAFGGSPSGCPRGVDLRGVVVEDAPPGAARAGGDGRREPGLSLVQPAPLCDAILRCSSTVREGNRRRPCGTYPRPSRAILYEGFPSISVPANRTEPVVRGGVSPMIAAQRVVFPMPLRPMIATGSAPTSNDTPWRTCARP